MKKIIIITIFILFAQSCVEGKKDKRLRISYNNWVGYTPLHYINKLGLMKDYVDFHILMTPQESVKLFNIGRIDGFAGTQNEYYATNTLSPQTIPTIFLDRSIDGDKVLSNMTVNQIKRSKNKIDVYLERQSINRILFKAFIKKHNFHISKFKVVNADQVEISSLNLNEGKKIIITYDPFSTSLLNKGFKEIGSSRDTGAFIIDAIFIRLSACKAHRQTIIALKSNINLAIEELKENPIGYYALVKDFLTGQSFDEFIKATKDIKWINKKISKEEKRLMRENNIPYEWAL